MPEDAPDEEPDVDDPAPEEAEAEEAPPEDPPSPEEIGVPEDEVVFEALGDHADEADEGDEGDEADEANAADEVGQAGPTPEARIAELEAELAERTDQLARAQADYQNYRKRMQREQAEARTEAKVKLLRVLVEALDDLDRALGAADPEDKVAQGVIMVTKRLGKQLADHGVETITPEPGEVLAPEHHEALMSEPSEDVPEGRIVETLQPGYMLEGRLVRPALVKVSDGPADDEPEADGEDEDH